MNLVRLGHYFVESPKEEGGGTCQTALVTGVNAATEKLPETVNVAIWTDGGGMSIPKRFVPIVADRGHFPAVGSFHLSGDCPWGK